MAVLSTKPRCAACGLKVAPGAATCPSCGTELAGPGTWTELSDWGIVRRRGRVWFVLSRGLFVGGSLALAAFATNWWSGSREPATYAVSVGSALAVGLLITWTYWHSAEREYRAAGESAHND